MDSYALSHLSDAVLLRSLADLVDHDRRTTAVVLAHIAEVDARRLYLESGWASMHAYCVGELHLSDDAACRRIQAARAARQFPALFDAVADGRLHLTAVTLIAPYLAPANVNELVEAVAGRRKPEIEAWLASRFAARKNEPPVRLLIRAIPGVAPSPNLAPPRVGTEECQLPLTSVNGEGTPALTSVDGSPALARVPRGPTEPDGTEEGHLDGGKPTLAQGEDEHSGGPLAASVPERYLLRLAISKSTHDKLRRAQALLSHSVASRDVAQLLDRALDALIAEAEKRKAGARNGRGAGRRSASDQPQRGNQRTRYIPAPIRRAIWERDGAQCTFVAANGTRCEARHFLEFDHVKPIARGGKATVEGLRLRCQAHNQYEAERAFGAEFMRRKREKARVAAAERRGGSAVWVREPEPGPNDGG